MGNDTQRDLRLDGIKALAISLVLFQHLQPVRILETNAYPSLTSILKFLINLFNQQLAQLAVPVFFLVSIYLFYQKAETAKLDYLRSRIRRLTEIFLFWLVCQFTFFYAVSILLHGYSGIQSPWHEIPELLMRGGPALPLVGDSVFYFIFVLLILVPLSFVLIIIGRTEKIIFTISSAAIVFFIIYFEIQNLQGSGIYYWDFENFLIYVPLAYVLLKYNRNKLRRLIPIIWACFIIFSIQDITLRHHGHVIGVYSRVSVVFGSTAIFSSFLFINDLKNTKFISFLAEYSMGIFATHKYLQLIVILLFTKLGWADSRFAISELLNLYDLTVAILSASLTLAAVYLLGRTPIKRYIM